MEKNVVAVVNGREITEKDLNFAVSRFAPERRAMFESPEGRKQLLEQLISWELLYDYAVDRNLEDSQEFKFQLEEARKAILTQLAVQETVSKITISEEEIKNYYENNIEAFAEPEQVSARHILVDSEDKAKEVIGLINNGMSFEEAAGLFSSCPSKSQGGSLGYFSRGMMVPEFEQAAFTMEPGKISEPVMTQFGYHIIKVEHKTAGQTRSLEESVEEIRNQILQEKQNSAYGELMNDLRKKYEVTIR
jgi:peptidyl-prolyl cis-trans isomerase C